MDVKWGQADTHIHSSFSDGMADIPEILHFVEHETDLDVIAITDHDEIAGSHLARELATRGKYRFEVVVGMEITTLDGHLVGL
ncbi:MAG: PHP domain-containing protein, partial [Chloroflexota bacterium]